MIKLEQLNLRDIMPQNLLADEKIANMANVLSKELQTVSLYAYKLNYTMNLRDLPEEVIDHLLWEKHIYPNEGLILAASLDEKISLLENSVELHRRKGTPYAIEQVLRSVNLTGEVFEWKEYDADPYHFVVELKPGGKIGRLKDVRTLIEEFKNKRSWFDGFVILASDDVLLLINESYDYPVYFKVCGEFSGESEFLHHNSGDFAVQDMSYDYPIEFEVNTIQSSLNEENVDLTEETYGYEANYKNCGEMEPIQIQGQQSTKGLSAVEEPYSYSAHYPVCGEFYAEEE